MITASPVSRSASGRSDRSPGRLRAEAIALAMEAARDGAIESLSIRDLSRRLGVSPGAIYRHFEDREAILRAVAEAGFALLEERFEAAAPFGSTPTSAAEALSRFERLALAYVGFARSHYGLWRLMFGPYGCDSQFQDPSRAPTYLWLGKALAELRAFGEIKAATPEDQYFVWTVIHGFSDLQASLQAAQAPDDDRTRDQALRALTALGRPHGGS